MNSTKISVIIPVYNSEKTIKECLESALYQSLRDMEIICIDDGSGDSSGEIIGEYCNKDIRIKIIRQENRGSAAARNRGLDAAEGEFISFLDADDKYAGPEVLEKLYRAAKDNNVFICGGSIILENPNKSRSSVFEDVDYAFGSDEMMSYQDLQQDYYFQRFIYDRCFLNENDLRFEDKMHGEDELFLVKTMMKAGKLYVIKDNVYCYHVGYKKSELPLKRVIDAVSALREVLDISRENNLPRLHHNALKHLSYFLDIIADNPSYRENGELNNRLYNLKKSLDISLISGLGIPGSFYRLYDLTENRRTICIKNAEECEKPAVSVILPVFNVKEYLEACLNSICMQSLSNIEIIIVNDGSTDDSLSEVFRYAGKDNRISVYTQVNSGLSYARNAGFSFAKGKYVYYMDSDDILVSSALEKMTSRADKDELDILFCNAEVFYEAEELSVMEEKEASYLDRKNEYAGIYKGAALISEMALNSEYCAPVWIQLINRDFACRNGLGFINGIIQEDNAYTFKAAMRARRAGFIPEKLYKRRIRYNSIMTNGNSFENVRGYLYSYLDMIGTMENTETNPETEEGLGLIIENVGKTCNAIYEQLIPEEKSKAHNLPPYQKKMFELLISIEKAEDDSGKEEQSEITENSEEDSFPPQIQENRRIINRILPSSRYDVSWSHDDITYQLQAHTKMIDSLIKMQDYLIAETCNLTGITNDLCQKFNDSEIKHSRRMYDISQSLSDIMKSLDENRNHIGKLIDDKADETLVVVENLFADHFFEKEFNTDFNIVDINTDCIKKGEIEGKILISVILPVYNVENYLEECLKSLIDQSLKSIEIICIDDGSTDNSRQILMKYSETDNRISVYSQKNSGLSAARNKGILLSRGRYVYFMDSDDVLDPLAMEKMHAAISNEGADIVFCGINVFSEKNNDPDIEIKNNWYDENSKYTGVYKGRDYLNLMIQNDFFVANVWRQLADREFILKNKLLFIHGILYEDVCYTFKACLCADKVTVIPDKLYNYRQRGDSITNKGYTFDNAYGYFINVINLYKMIRKTNITIEEKKNYESYLHKMKMIGIKIYNQLDINERLLYKNLPFEERHLFENIIIKDRSIRKLNAMILSDKAIKADPIPYIYSESRNGMIDSELIHGAGLLGDRSEVFEYLPKGGICAEVGVAYGDFSEKIINGLRPEHFYAVDLFEITDIWGRHDIKDSELDHEGFYKNRFKDLIPETVSVCKGISWEILERFEDDSLDYIYIDASHRYEDVSRDINAAQRKIKNGGIIQFNDYTEWDMFNSEYYGVIPAVNEFVNRTRSKVLYYCLNKYGFDDIVIKINKNR